jgi:hypothetical protein
MCPEDERGQSPIVAPVQIRITHSATHLLTPAKGGGNGGPVEREENQEQVSHSPHRPLEISPTARDSHIPTAKLRPMWSSGKPKSGFPLLHMELATMTCFTIQPNTNKKGKWPGKPVHFHAHLALEPKCSFMLILQLDNAVGAA